MGDRNIREEFCQAVADHLAPEVANRLWSAWSFLGLLDDEGEDALGRGLAVAMSTLDPAVAASHVDAMALRSVSIDLLNLTLTPTEAQRHPLIGRWASPTFGEGLAEAIRSGRTAADLSPDTPVFQVFGLDEKASAIAGAFIQFQRHDVSVTLNYGAPGSAGFGRHVCATGSNVYLTGSALRHGRGLLTALRETAPAIQPIAGTPPLDPPSSIH